MVSMKFPPKVSPVFKAAQSFVWPHTSENPLLDVATPLLQSPLSQLVGGPAWIALSRKFAHSIPTPEALEAIKDHTPNGIVSIGAGNGYWENLISRMGVSVAAFDNYPPKRSFCKVWIGDEEKARERPDKALMLCFPLGEDSTMSSDILEAYMSTGGGTVVFIGEDSKWGYATGNKRFFELLKEHFTLVKEVSLPQRLHYGSEDHEYTYRDALYIYKRNPSESI